MNFEKLPKIIIVLSIQLIMLAMWILAGWPKLFDADYATRFVTRFEGSFFMDLPGGMGPQIFFLGILELVAGALTATSLFRREFLHFNFKWMNWALAVSSITFLFLGFGLRVINDFTGFANIFFYFGATVVFYIFLNNLSKQTTADYSSANIK